ncbi:MAG TPA: GerMN domain-containing protein [Acidimicrobiales bacterium]|jgi:hypothetical protein|nr:GerMN domain-containing protein [Acidimicrobiales bacterium]
MKLGVRLLSLFGLLTIAVVAGPGCGVQPDDRPRPLAVEDVPYGLLDEGPPLPQPGAPSTPSVDRVNVAVYYLVGERLHPAPRAVPDPPTPIRVINALLEGPTDEEAVNGVRTAINPTTQATVSRPAPDIVNVDLTSDVAAVPTLELRLAIGQIVFTMTGIEGVQGVKFTVGGASVAVPLPDGTVTSDPVNRDDFPAIAPLPPTPANGPA